MKNKRSDFLKHQPRGIIKWAPFNSLPEFTTQLKANHMQPRGGEQIEKNNTRREEWDRF